MIAHDVFILKVILVRTSHFRLFIFDLQSFLARKSLNSQLQRAGALSSTDCISNISEDFEIFKTSE